MVMRMRLAPARGANIWRRGRANERSGAAAECERLTPSHGAFGRRSASCCGRSRARWRRGCETTSVAWGSSWTRRRHGLLRIAWLRGCRRGGRRGPVAPGARSCSCP